LLFAQYQSATQYSGYVQVNKQYDANLFYLFYESQTNPSKDPIILWLQGGPGCSSMLGCFIENGPQQIQTDGTFVDNKYSWNTNSSIIYIDSPVGTGYSYVTNNFGYATDETTIAEELYVLLYQFLFVLHPEYSNLPFYIFGESYAGKYVPYLASAIIDKNVNAKMKIKLSGIAIGNGWVNPYIQTGSYAPYLYNHGLINYVELEFAKGVYEMFKVILDIKAYFLADEVGNSLLSLLLTESGVNDVYDIRQETDPTDAYIDALDGYLNSDDAQKLFNVSGHSWEMCAPGPYIALLEDEEQSSMNLFPNILLNVPVLLYNGYYDLICNWEGTDSWSNILEWPFQDQYNKAKNQTWTVNGKSAGFFKTADNLAFLVVDNAGHMSPFDQPENLHDMIYRFIKGGFHN